MAARVFIGVAILLILALIACRGWFYVNSVLARSSGPCSYHHAGNLWIADRHPSRRVRFASLRRQLRSGLVLRSATSLSGSVQM